MGLTWLSPALFAALGALVVPVMLHLAAQRQREGRAFPSLLFLRQVRIRRERRRRLRDPLLFVLRCLALAALVAAFAEPVSDALDVPAADAPAPELVLLDRSASMAVGEVWAAALDAARARLDARQPQQRMALVSFQRELRVEAGFDATDAELRAALERLQPGDGAGHIDAALEAAEALLAAQADSGAGRIYLVSDLQRSGRRGGIAARLDARTQVEIAGLPGAADDGADIGPVRLGEGSDIRDRLILEVRSRAAVLDEPVPITLRVDGEAAQAAVAAASDTGRRTVEVPVVRGADHDVTIEARIDGDDTARRWFGVLPARRPLTVAVSLAADGRERRYLEAALALLPRVEVLWLDGARWPAAGLAPGSVLLAGPDALPDAATLEAFLRGGGHAVLFAVRAAQLPEWLPGAVGGEASSAGGSAWRLVQLEPGHRLAARLQPSADQPLATQPVWRRQDLKPRDGARVVARFDDGSAALLEADVGRGRVMQFATALDDDWSALGRDAAFAPLLLEMLRSLAGDSELPLSHRAGEAVDVAALWRLAGVAERPARFAVEFPDGSVRELAVEQSVLQAGSAGIYTVHGVGSTARLRFAASVPVEELDRERLDAQAWLARIERRSGAAPAVRAAAEADTPRARPWSMLLLALALALLFAEAALGNWLTSRRAAPV